MGEGKLKDVKEKMDGLETRVLVIDDELTPAQQRNIENGFPMDYKIVDRTTLILDIFAQHARSREGKLQVELAQNQYRLPRLTRLWTHLIRQAGGRSGGIKGGVGLRGPGETQIESDRRQMRRRISVLKHQIEEIRLHRKQHRRQRKRQGIPVITLVGYTNAGKSSLLKALSSADVMIKDQLFATLDPTTRRVHLPGGKEVLFTDTVGFINKLPLDLVAAFRATLEEITESDLILHLVDMTHPKSEAQTAVVEKTLGDLGVGKDRILTVWNKSDKIDGSGGRENNGTRISALTGDGIDSLLHRIETLLHQSMKPVEILLPYTAGNLLNEIHNKGSVEVEEHKAEGTYLRAYLPASLANRLDIYRIRGSVTQP